MAVNPCCSEAKYGTDTSEDHMLTWQRYNNIYNISNHSAINQEFEA
jgi:hypothetical protein